MNFHTQHAYTMNNNSTYAWAYPSAAATMAMVPDLVDGLFLDSDSGPELNTVLSHIDERDYIPDADVDALLDDLDMPDEEVEAMLNEVDIEDLVNDEELWRDVEASLTLDTAVCNNEATYVTPSPSLPPPSLSASPATATYSSSAAGFSPFTEATTSPGSSTGSDGSQGHAFPCAVAGCFKTFRKECQLKQHQRVHRKSLFCPYCPAANGRPHCFAQVRDLERHMHAQHASEAARRGVRSEERQCPHPGCGHRGRRDNVSRHHKSKHGRELQWKRGVPIVIVE